MEEIATIGLDLAKSVFQVHGSMRRVGSCCGASCAGQHAGLFRGLAAGTGRHGGRVGAHYWAREFTHLGHTVRLTPPAYVKAYVKRGKSDAADAEAICEAVTRPTMRFVPAKNRGTMPCAPISPSMGSWRRRGARLPS